MENMTTKGHKDGICDIWFDESAECGRMMDLLYCCTTVDRDV